MELAQVVARFVDGPITGGTVADNGRFINVTNPVYRFGIACHQATFIWLYKAAHGSEIFPPAADVMGAQEVLNQLILRGNAKRVTATSAPLASDVLIFADSDGQAQHSCVVKRGGADGVIGGYNQQNWFDGDVPVLQNDYSEYGVGQIRWAGPAATFHKQRAFDNKVDNPTALKLWAVRGATAVGFV